MDVSGDAPGSFSLVEQPVEKPWIKDYDKSNPPSTLPSRWDLANWAIFLVIAGSSPVGGCIVAHNTPGVHRLQGRIDLAVLWDIRIAPNYRRRGLGRNLFDTATEWAQSRHCIEMQVETQNINVKACRFYQSAGCVLFRVTRDAYDECPGEHQLIWSKQLLREHKAVQ